MAKRSATESAAILDVCRRLTLIDDASCHRGRELLLRIVSMLIAIIRRDAGAGTGRGTGTGTNEDEAAGRSDSPA